MKKHTQKSYTSQKYSDKLTSGSQAADLAEVGPGVFELRDQDERAWYRVFYLKKIAGLVYVLHCFEKQTAQTERKDIEVAKERLKRLREEQSKKPKKEVDRPPDQGKRSR